MAKFMVRKSELKNVCKAVNDRKLAELKKEIIEILKKQDEKEVKKAVDYFNSQELHYSHLEKSFNGKWIEKAGYGVGTVRIWKGKKYKKIAPGKWARVFDKEGRGTNIAIGKLIARVNKIDNAEDLLQFVMENKQRFVDEDGRELGILDKVRAAVDTRNEKLSGESSTYVYGVGENVNRAKNEMFSKKDKITKEEADLHKVSRKLSQIPTTELKQEKARLERAVANKTRSKRDSLNNAIFRESNQKKLDAINKELEKRSNKVAEKKVDNPYDSMNEKEIDIEVSKELDNLAAKSKKPTIHEAANYIKENNKELYNNLEKRWGDSLISALADVAIDRKNKKDNESKKPAEKKKSFKQEMDQLYDAQDEAWEGFESGSEIKSSPENSKKFYEKVKKFVDNNNIRLSKKHYEEIADRNGHSFNEALALAGAYGEENKKRALAKNRENAEKYKGAVLDLSIIDEFKTEESEVEKHQNRSDAMKGNKNTEKGGEDTEDKEQQRINMQLQLLELNKNRQDNNKNIKKLNSKLAELKQKKSEDEARGNSVEKYDKEIKDTQKEIDNLLDDNYSIENKGTKIAKELNAMEKDGVKKSIFDDFVIDMFINDEIEDEEELKEGETEYNDYSAEQPELFNSVEFAVREALNRRFNCL
ncbi:MAG: hypothetical protein K6E97_03660 [Treponema sp.]|nr:hypothetical protein [Treponema sp.]